MRSRTYAELQHHTPASEGPAAAAAQAKRERRQRRNLGIKPEVYAAYDFYTAMPISAVTVGSGTYFCVLIDPEPEHGIVLKGRRGESWGYCPTEDGYTWVGSRPHLRRLAASHG